jgi:hypothetical protein
MPWENMPKFLICSDPNVPPEWDEEDRDDFFMLHTQHPRFLLRFVQHTESDLVMIDEASKEELGPLLDEARQLVYGFIPRGVGD